MSSSNDNDNSLPVLAKFAQVHALWKDIQDDRPQQPRQKQRHTVDNHVDSLGTPLLLLAGAGSSRSSRMSDMDVMIEDAQNYYMNDDDAPDHNHERNILQHGDDDDDYDVVRLHRQRRRMPTITITTTTTIYEDNDLSRDNVQPETPPWYANPMQMTAMISNFSTSYNVVNISLVLPILEHLWPSTSTETNKSGVASALLAGMMVGQVVGGALGDTQRFGRLGALALVMLVQILASLASALLCHNYQSLMLCRFLLGCGAGGVYPLAAVLSAEQQQKQQENCRTLRSHSNTTPSPPSPAAHNIASSSPSSSSLRRVVLTFSMQGVGFLAVPLVTILLLRTVSDLQVVWRVILALGCVPGIFLALLLQLQCSSSSSNPYSSSSKHHHNEYSSWGVHRLWGSNKTYHHPDAVTVPITDNVEEDVEEIHDTKTSSPPLACEHEVRYDDDEHDDDIGVGSPAHPQSSLSSSSSSLQEWYESIRHEPDLMRKFIGTAGTWFFFDVLFYGNTLFQPIVTEAAFASSSSSSSNAQPPSDEDPTQRLLKIALNSLILTLIAIPGYAVAGMVLGRRKSAGSGRALLLSLSGCSQTPRYVMLQGFLVMSLLYLIIGVGWVELRHHPTLLVLLYSLTFFFANYGPNTTTFVLPSMVYSTHCRSTLNGISAAMGKLGAWTGATLFAPAADELGDQTVLIVCSMISLVAFFLTWYFVPHRIGCEQEEEESSSSSSSSSSHTFLECAGDEIDDTGEPPIMS